MQDATTEFRETRASPAHSACRGVDHRRGPAPVHGIDEHPGAAVSESEAAGRLRQRAACLDLLEQVSAGFRDGSKAVGLNPDASAQHDVPEIAPRPRHEEPSAETMTSVALITAVAGFPFLSFSRLADEALIKETIWWPPPISMTTSLMT